jgi:hypothetical protein
VTLRALSVLLALLLATKAALAGSAFYQGVPGISSGGVGSCASAESVVKPISSSTYMLEIGDRCKILLFESNAPVAFSLPNAAGFPTGFRFSIRSSGPGYVTMTPTGAQLNGLSSPITILPGTGADVWTASVGFYTQSGVAGQSQPLFVDGRKYGVRADTVTSLDGNFSGNSLTSSSVTFVVGRDEGKIVKAAGVATAPANTATLSGTPVVTRLPVSVSVPPGTRIPVTPGTIPTNIAIGAKVYDTTDTSRLSPDAGVVGWDDVNGFIYINATSASVQLGDSILIATRHVGTFSEGVTASGSSTISVAASGGALVNDLILDETNSAALTFPTLVTGTTLSPPTVSVAPVTAQQINDNEAFGFYTTGTVTATGPTVPSNVLTFASGPVGAAVGQRIKNRWNPSSFRQDTAVMAVDTIAHTVTTSNPISGTGVLLGDEIEFQDTVTLSEAVSGHSVTYDAQYAQSLAAFTRLLSREINLNEDFRNDWINAGVAGTGTVITIPSWDNDATSWSATVATAGTLAVTFGTTTVPAPFRTTIATVTGQHSVTLTTEVTLPQVATQFSFGTDDTAALNAARLANLGSTIALPAGQIMVDGQVANGDIAWQCQKPPHQFSSPAGFVLNGTTFVVTSLTEVPFRAGRATTFDSCQWFWPGQYVQSVVPYPYAKAYGDVSADDVIGNLNFIDPTVINAYDWIYQTGTTPTGHINIERPYIFALRHHISRQRSGETLRYHHGLYAVTPYAQVITTKDTSWNLRNWFATNGVWWDFRGNGTFTSSSTFNINTFISQSHGFSTGTCFLLRKANIAESYFTNLECTATKGIDSLNSGINRINWETVGFGSRPLLNGAHSFDDVSPTIEILHPVPKPEDVEANSIRIGGGNLLPSAGSYASLYGEFFQDIKIDGIQMRSAYGRSTSTAGLFYFAEIAAPNAALSIQNNRISAPGLTANKGGISINGVIKQGNIIGNPMERMMNPITLNNVGTSPIMIMGNTSAYDRVGSVGIAGTIGTGVTAINKWGTTGANGDKNYANGVLLGAPWN